MISDEKITGDKKVKILVIDDDNAVCNLMRTILVRSNYYVEAYTNSREALERFKVYSFDMVITDLQMPEFSGWDVALQVKKLKRSVPVILVTGTYVNLDEESLLKRGINVVISKPLSVQTFLETVTSIIDSFCNNSPDN